MRNKLISSLLAGAVFTLAVSGLAFASDMAVKMPVKAPPPAPPPVPYIWTGFYGGLNVGWSWGHSKNGFDFSEVSVSVPGRFSDITHPNGAVGGVQFGYNWQATPTWILGFETDIQLTGERDSTTLQGVLSPQPILDTLMLSHTESLDWFGTVRGRLGYTIWPTAILYATGGLAYGRLKESAGGMVSVITRGIPQPPIPISSTSWSSTKTGWTVGGGIEGVMPNSRVTWKFEYLYIDLDGATYTLQPSTFPNPAFISTRFSDNIVRVGLNYQFH